MPKYRVVLCETVKYWVEVEAGDAADAEDLACEVWAASENPTADFNGYGQGVEVTWSDEITD